MKKLFLALMLNTLILSGSSFIKGDTINNEYINQIPESGKEEIKDEVNDEIIKDEIEGEQEEVEVLPNKPIIFIYLNPSVQTKNYYYGNLGNEAQHMQDIAHLMYDMLVNIPFIKVDCNTYYSTLSLKESLIESNSQYRHIHFALHSNAGGGSGTEIYTKDSVKFATHMYNKFLTLGNFNKRGVKKQTVLYETNNSKAEHTALMEFLFHDRENEALFIVNNKKTIAETMVDGLIDFIEETYW